MVTVNWLNVCKKTPRCLLILSRKMNQLRKEINQMAKFIKLPSGAYVPATAEGLLDIYGTDTFFSTEKDFVKVSKHTRAGKRGKMIRCPHCKNMERVYHFAWSAAVCPKCKKTINKYDYYVFRKNMGYSDET